MTMNALRLFSILPFAAAAAAQWHQPTPAAAPAARYTPGMTFDSAANRTILFGGAKTTFGNWNDTWSFNGTTWTQLAPLASPSARPGIDLVYDELRGLTVMYGGGNTSPFGGPSLDQTWEFNGVTWTQVATANTPGGLTAYGMAYDALRYRTVLYGGLHDSFFPIDSADTWEYDGVNWTHVTTAHNPGPLENPAICYHAVLGKVVMFGGIDVQTGGTTTTWSYDGIDWTPIAVAGPSPSARTMARMVYDPQRGVSVMYGGMNPNTGAAINETWEFNGVAWTQRTDLQPPDRRGFGLAFDTARHVAVAFGGVDANFTARTDTWQYGGLVESFGAGCLGTAGVPVLTASQGARLGQVFQSTMSHLHPAAPIAVTLIGTSSTNSGGLPLPADLGFLGLPGCTLYGSGDITQFDSAGGGTSVDNLFIPNDQIYLGVEFFVTGVSLDTVNSFGAVLSNALRCRVGY